MPSVLLFNGGNAALWLVLGVSVVVGLLMVVVFRYTSDQKAIGRAKDALKAHLLAVRLFQDQLPVVLRAYAKILGGTGRYLRLAFTPFLVAVIPMTFLLVQVDRYLGWMPLQTSQNFLLEAQADGAEMLDQMELRLPDGLVSSAPAVHVPEEKMVVWRLVAKWPGQYDVGIVAGGQTTAKHIVVSSEMERISPVRLRGSLWERMFSSAEPAIEGGSAVHAISVNYSERTISLFDMEWNWLVLFFIVSLISGFIFKSVLGIKI